MSMNSLLQMLSANFRGIGKDVLPTTTALAELEGSGGVTSWLNGVVGVNSPWERVASTAR